MAFAIDYFTTGDSQVPVTRARRAPRKSWQGPKVDHIFDLLQFSLFLAAAAVPLVLLNEAALALAAQYR